MDLHEFSWEQTTEGGGEGQQLDLRIIRQSNGTYKMHNLKDPSQTYQCDSPDQAVGAFEDLVQRSPQQS